jgi:hypothetical protein
MPLTRGSNIGYDAVRMTFRFTMLRPDGVVVDCGISSAAMDDLFDTKGASPEPLTRRCAARVSCLQINAHRQAHQSSDASGSSANLARSRTLMPASFNICPEIVKSSAQLEFGWSGV